MLEDRFYFCLDLDRFVFNSALEWGEKFYKVGGKYWDKKGGFLHHILD